MCDSAGASGKRKLPPKTFLCEFANGIVTDSPLEGDDMFKWGFTKTNTLVILKDKGAQPAFRVSSWKFVYSAKF